MKIVSQKEQTSKKRQRPIWRGDIGQAGLEGWQSRSKQETTCSNSVTADCACPSSDWLSWLHIQPKERLERSVARPEAVGDDPFRAKPRPELPRL